MIAARAALAQTDWGPDRLLVAGALGQFGIAADRTPGPDTVFAAAIVRGPVGDTLRLVRTTDRGETWSSVWRAFRLSQRFSCLCLRYGSGTENWVYLFWLADDGRNSGDIHGARIAPDGSAADYLQPVPEGPDTLRWLTMTRSFLPDYTLHLFYQDELGGTSTARAPRVMYTASTDFGLTWSAPVSLLDSAESPACDCGALGRVYLTARSISRNDIIALRSLDSGLSWDSTWISTDSFSSTNRFPSVAATHVEPPSHAWVTYDVDGSALSVRGAFTTDGGETWSRNRPVASRSGQDQFWSRLDCPPDSSQTVRVTLVSEDGAGYKVSYREGTNPNPFYWTPRVLVGDSVADNTGPPLVTSYGMSGDSGNQGVILYAQSGPQNLWCDARHFAGLLEEPARLRSLNTGLLQARLVNGALRVDGVLNQGGLVRLSLYRANGRRFRVWNLGFHGAGALDRSVDPGPLPAGAYFVRLSGQAETATARLTAF